MEKNLEYYKTIVETKEHIDNVRRYMLKIAQNLISRAMAHDSSKLEDPELETFIKYTPKLADTTYGSDEYNGYLKEMKVALDHHYKLSRHHPEHFGSYYECENCGQNYYDDLPENNICDLMIENHHRMVKCKGNLIRKSNIDNMTLTDLIEMICDWKAATLRHTDGDINVSLTKCKDKFNIAPQLLHILENTVKAEGMTNET